MKWYDGVPHSRVMFNEFQPKAFLRAFGWGTIQMPKLLELSNCCSVINTRSRWLPNARQVGRHGQLKHTSLLNYSPLYPKANFIFISLLFFYKKNLWWRFRSLLIHSLVTPDHKNMEKSSIIFEYQPLKIEIEQKFYLSGQTWYLINSLNKASSVSNCCELKRNIFFSNFAFYTLFIVI